MNISAEKRRRRSAKVIYDMLVSRIRSEEDALLDLSKKIGAMKKSSDKDVAEKQFEDRRKTKKTLQHSLDWLVDQIISDRRNC